MGVLADLGFWGTMISLAAIYSLFALGLQLQVGHAGLLNFGHVGFMAVGGYGMAIAAERGMSIVPAMVVGVVAAAIAALLVGIPTLRLRADYLAIVTIALGEIVRHFALNLNDLTGGPRGILAGGVFRESVQRPMRDWFEAAGWEIDRRLPLIIATWLAVLVVFTILTYLVRTPWGRTLRAVREDEDAARALGKNAWLYKIQALIIGAMVAGLAGEFFAFHLSFMAPDAFRPAVTFVCFIIIILGGMGSLPGAILGAIVIQGLFEGTRYLDLPITSEQEAAARYVVVGLALMVLVAFRPQGLLGNRKEMVLEK